MGSKRLPGKVLLPLGGKSILQWVVERASRISQDIPIVVLTGNRPENTPIIDWCNEHAIECFVGSEDNVLDRFVMATKKYEAKNIIRLTADNPFVDYVQAEILLAAHMCGHFNYSSNKTEFGSKLPIGVGIEIFGPGTLESILQGMGSDDRFGACGDDEKREQRIMEYKEHINEFIFDHIDGFSCCCLSYPIDYSSFRFTIDTPQDYKILKRIANSPDIGGAAYWKIMIRTQCKEQDP